MYVLYRPEKIEEERVKEKEKGLCWKLINNEEKTVFILISLYLLKHVSKKFYNAPLRCVYALWMCVMIEYEQNMHTCTNDNIQSSWMNMSVLLQVEFFIFLNSNTPTQRQWMWIFHRREENLLSYL